MKKLLAVAVMSYSLYACKSVHVVSQAPDAAARQAADTALQGDTFKNATKQ